MISRIWHGWTTPGNADKYEALLAVVPQKARAVLSHFDERSRITKSERQAVVDIKAVRTHLQFQICDHQPCEK